MSDRRRKLDVITPPVTRADCVDGPRPCPWVRCRHHLYLEVVAARDGSGMKVRPNYPDWHEVSDMRASCSLDVADDGGHTLEQVAEVFWVTRERARQIEQLALHKLRQAMADLFDDDEELEARLRAMLGGQEP